MKKLTFITMQLKTPGGIERFVATLTQILSQDFEIEIVANYGNKSDGFAFKIPKNVKTTFLSENQPAEISLKNLIVNFKWSKIPAEFIRRHKIKKEQNKVFKTYLKALKTDYIITDRAKYNFLVQKFYRGTAQKIATDHNFHQNNPKYIKTLIRSLNSFDALVVATTELYDFYKNKILPAKCYKIPNPLPNIPTKKSSLKTKNLLAIGRFVPEKDFPTLIDIMAIVHQKDPEIHLALIGDGPEKEKIKTKIKNFNLEDIINLPGFLSPEKIQQYFYDSSLFVMTSETEAFGLVLTEAMSYGIPCVALSRASGAKAQLSRNLGSLVDTPEEMATTIVNLINNPIKLQQYQNKINNTIQEYSPVSVKKLWLELLNSPLA